MAKQQGLVVRLRIEGARGTLQAFRDLPKDANAELRRGSLELSQSLALKVASAARSDGPQSALIAPTVKANRDRMPSLSAGGSKRVGRNRKPAHKIMMGSEFGSNRLPQFRPHQGQSSYWFFSTVQNDESNIAERWQKMADDILKKWANAPKGADG